jgi:eukaryotic-like serine/threonine-protein kinase
VTAAGDLVGGRYRLERPIGSGGMASVWRATDEGTGAVVAVKRMHPRVQEDADLLVRFRREAQVVARLDHPCIVRLIDEGADDDDGPYIVFELVEGTTLKALIRQRGHLSPAEAASIASQIARGLELAHRSGIVHRDIKSHNILVTDDGVAKLTDFGIARLLDGMQDGLTRTGTVLGTSDYLAPEQARGLGVDGRTDVYALGIVLYESLTGELPFPADTPMGVALRQVRDPMPDPRMVRPEVPPYLAAIVMRACEKDPTARFPHALAMADALLDAPSGGTVTMPVIPAEVAAADADTGRLDPATLREDGATGVIAPVGATAGSGAAREPAPRRRRWPLALAAAVIAAGGAGTAVLVSTGGADLPIPGIASDDGGGTGVADGLVALPLQAVTDADPEGEGREMPGEVPLAYDGNTATAWRTERYATADFGGLKQGVGLSLRLRAPAVARQLVLTSPSVGGAFEMRAGDAGPSDRVVGRGSFDGGTLRVPLDAGDASDSYMLWITELPPNTGGEGFRAYIAEVELEGQA